ncbi:MAG: 4Fe-4S single cluster domain [Solirubrobacteraceae bacterium]|jgi:ferredoxin|nr:4Fe-4S single cluster domain [Solirubrobacteraceae bacterium]MEA2276338.1 4Fe-4S single cluster domain [Solirubrobacteraceae bacterium]MEA2359826.1 4Fe-4S single cluster domain [Solirubrobacteraceae bacterium]MEA2393862.1 4Fe-4S single cluster domain [Solirubrobacteraceae bacterium]
MQIISVDLDCCAGHGKCYRVAPDLVRPKDDHGHAEFFGDPVDPGDAERVTRGDAAINRCPEQALSWQQV